MLKLKVFLCIFMLLFIVNVFKLKEAQDKKIISSIENKAPSMANRQAPIITIEGKVVLGSLNVTVKKTIKEKFVAFANNLKAAFDNDK